MSSRTDDLTDLHAQLAEKNGLVAALTSQLERMATQLDRINRTGAERQGYGSNPNPIPPFSPEVANRLTSALDEWQEFQPAGRIERIESGIDRILELLQSPPVQQAVPQAAADRTTASKLASADDFWAATKARLLGESPPEAAATSPTSADQSASGYSNSTTLPGRPAPEEPSVLDVGDGPEAPTPIQDFDDREELQSGIKSRDAYVQYLISRVRLAESRSYFPTNWDQLAHAPDRFRERLESLETVLNDHLRQAEVANSLERALLARERAKLAQIKQNLEIQIRKMAVAPSTSSPSHASQTPDVPDQKVDQESRWKRIFSR